MTTITLTPDIETPLTERARQQGTTPELLALDGLRRLFAPEQAPSLESPAGETLFDFLEGYVGTVSGTSEALSENCGPRFAEGMAENRSTASERVQL